MPKCSYCGSDYEFPRGLTLVDTIGKVKYYCSSKCRKYALMNRKKGKWALTKEQQDVLDRAEDAKQKKAEKAKELKAEEKK